MTASSFQPPSIDSTPAEAPEADVQEQRLPASVLPPEDPEAPVSDTAPDLAAVSEGDAAEQALEVPLDEEEWQG